MVTARRNDTWRVFDFFWMLHIMDYEERENFNNPLLITASVFALVTVLAGLLLLVLRLQRLVRMELARRR
ncbi:MAG: exosortase/archaeosortase [Maricaulis maris]|jgi:exosortase/archaeosortase